MCGCFMAELFAPWWSRVPPREPAYALTSGEFYGH